MIELMGGRFLVLTLIMATLSGLLAISLINIPKDVGAEEGGDGWESLPLAWRTLAKDTEKKIAKMQLWGETKGAAAQEGQVGQVGKSLTKGQSSVVVTWFFKGVISEGMSRYVLVAEDKNAAAQPYIVGDTLPGGERLEDIGVDWLRFSLSAENHLEESPDAAAEHNRLLYEISAQ